MVKLWDSNARALREAPVELSNPSRLFRRKVESLTLRHNRIAVLTGQQSCFFLKRLHSKSSSIWRSKNAKKTLQKLLTSILGIAIMMT
jgi:hypothetical protein